MLNWQVNCKRKQQEKLFANKSRISSKTPVYVTGLDRGVLPIGSCETSITLSTFSKPKISLCFPGFSLE